MKRPLSLECTDHVRATFIRRPSAHNRSPYVGDIQLEDGSMKIVHMPAMDMGGKCHKGVQCLVIPIIDKEGNQIEDGTLGGQYNKPVCQYKMKLVHCCELENEKSRGTWILANPSMSESIFKEIVDQKLCKAFDKYTVLKSQFSVPNTNMRSDFLLDCNGKKHIVEVKIVVDTDYDSTCEHDDNIQSLYFQPSLVYRRSALFPWGRSHQRDEDGNKVVSARAIKHVKELTSLVENGDYEASIVFMICRSDVYSFTPNKESCPQFVTHLKNAQDKGVHLRALKVNFDEDGRWVYDRMLPVVI